jgi:type 1 glutamine amidotransferase
VQAQRLSPAFAAVVALAAACGDESGRGSGGGGSGGAAASTTAPGPTTTATPASTGSGSSATGTGGSEPTPPNILVFSKTVGFRHASIDVAVPAVTALGEARGWMMNATEDAGVFTASGLEPYDVVVFLMTTGDVLDEAQQVAFEGFIQRGGAYAGVHSASDTEYDWPFYGDLVGAYFTGHPSPQNATLIVDDAGHPSTSHLAGATWMRFDEWYSFDHNPRDEVTVLLTLDEGSYDPGGLAMGDHPIAWVHEFSGGRSFYTAGGHTNESWSEPDFLDHVMGGIAWAANTSP